MENYKDSYVFGYDVVANIKAISNALSDDCKMTHLAVAKRINRVMDDEGRPVERAVFRLVGSSSLSTYIASKLYNVDFIPKVELEEVAEYDPKVTLRDRFSRRVTIVVAGNVHVDFTLHFYKHQPRNDYMLTINMSSPNKDMSIERPIHLAYASSRRGLCAIWVRGHSLAYKHGSQIVYMRRFDYDNPGPNAISCRYHPGANILNNEESAMMFASFDKYYDTSNTVIAENVYLADYESLPEISNSCETVAEWCIGDRLTEEQFALMRLNYA
ncbi:MAG: hypothetical protein CMN60_20775 [Sphingobium sp.]|nr:hypothetical protein [Sphingobium sp.]|tara:strand:+ start:95114 stop:95926 length:813 start_codon:yes stop_codon:yes gene_type:complete